MFKKKRGPSHPTLQKSQPNSPAPQSSTPPNPTPTSPKATSPAPLEHRSPIIRTACYVDFENLFYQCQQKQRALSVSQTARSLTRLSREVQGEGFAHTAVYANWDRLSNHSRYAQSAWAEVGWRTVAVPSREDILSGRNVKNLVDFIMSLDILEDARDRGYEHFFLVTGDADFCEVVERLKRLRRRVTMVSLSSGASYRLREAADQTVIWELEDVSGEESFPLKPSRQAPRGPRLPRPSPTADEFSVLKLAFQAARAEQVQGPLNWELIRDQYYLPMLGRGDRPEADLFIRELAEVGYVTLQPQRTVKGEIRHQLQLNL